MLNGNGQVDPDTPDEQLVAEYQRTHDKALFDILMHRYRPSLVSFCTVLVRNHAVAEEIVQEVFLNAHAAIDSFQPGSFKAWLRTIAARLAYNYLGSAAVRRETEMPDVELAGRHAHAADFASTLLILQILNRIQNPMQKACLKLFYIEGFKCKEIATHLAIPPEAVKSHIQNGKIHFKNLWLAPARGGEQAK